MTEEQQQMVEDCINRESKLTSWEAQFIDGIASQEYALTVKQAEFLNQIWERITA